MLTSEREPISHDERLARTSQKIDAIRDALETNAVQEALGSDKSSELRALSQRLFIPDFDGKTISIDSYPEEKIPVIGVVENEPVWDYDPILVMPTDEQVENMDFYLAASGLNQRRRQEVIGGVKSSIYHNAYKKPPYNIPTLPGSQIRFGYVSSHTSVERINPTRPALRFKGRPLVTLNLSARLSPADDAPGGIHELIHVHQTLTNPVHHMHYDELDQSHRELEAHSMQHLVTKALGQSDPFAEAIYDVMQSEDPEIRDTYQPTPSVLKKLAAKNITL